MRQRVKHTLVAVTAAAVTPAAIAMPTAATAIAGAGTAAGVERRCFFQKAALKFAFQCRLFFTLLAYTCRQYFAFEFFELIMGIAKKCLLATIFCAFGAGNCLQK